MCLISYNSRGFSEMNQNFMKTLTSDQVIGDKIPILCNQENFILRGNFYKILQAMTGFHVIFNPAVKNSLDRGRPKGGMFIAIPDEMKNQVVDVSPGHWRIQAVVIKSAKSKTLLINIYFPCDSGGHAGGNLEEAIEVAEIVKRVVGENQCDSLVWCGDFNTDFRRNSGLVDLVAGVSEELQLLKIWDKYDIDFTRVCSINNDITQTSIIDHFLYSSGLRQAV
jgi:exonuclease III